MKTVKFYTLGCKVNQYDTQEIREKFLGCGFKELDNGRKADVYVINTCTVTGKADADSLNYIRRAGKENPDAKLIVTGCLAGLDKQRIKEAFARAVIVENKNKGRISGGLRSTSRRGVTYFSGRTRAFLKIQDGCDNFCSYCKVPLVRGRSKSKPLVQIKKEAEALAENGFKEIVLTGICLGAYGRDFLPKKSLVDAISAIEGIAGALRIRLSSIEAFDVDDALIVKIAASPKLCRHLHIPIQSGDDAILKKMNRRYRREDYLKLISKLKKRIPGIAITTDVLVGFPGESEANFKNTLDLVKRIKPLKVHIFPYSRREGTPAADSVAGASPQVIKARIGQLKILSEKCALSYQKKFLGRAMPVLFEGRSKDKAGYWEGHAGNYLRVRVKSARELANRIVRVKLQRVEGGFIEGSPAKARLWG